MIKPYKMIPMLIFRGASGSRNLKLWGGMFLNLPPDPETTLSLSFRSFLTVSALPCHASLVSKPAESYHSKVLKPFPICSSKHWLSFKAISSLMPFP